MHTSNHVSSVFGNKLARSSLLLIILFTAMFWASAQERQERPVARLVTTVSPYTRPRRVVPATGNPTGSMEAVSLAAANDIERRAFAETNRLRHQNGLPPLTWDGQLWQLARAYSESMGRQGFFAHTNPQGLRLKDRARLAGISSYALAENIACSFGYDDPGGYAVERWMTSPGHRANILYAGFQGMAVGTFIAADGSVYLTQVFIAR